MKQKNLSELTDQELLLEAKKARSTAIIDAILIGAMIGVVFYSVMQKTFGILMLIPLFLAYKLISKPKYKNRELENLLKERGLK